MNSKNLWPRVLSEMQGEPDRDWRTSELAARIKNTSTDYVGKLLTAAAKRGDVETTKRGVYRLVARVATGQAAATKPLVAEKPTAPPRKPAAPVDHLNGNAPTLTEAPRSEAPIISEVRRVVREETAPRDSGRARLRILHVEIEGDLSDATMRAALDELRRAVG